MNARSVARGEADERSDVDLLVDLEPGRSLLDLGGLLMDLRDLLHRNVDAVTELGLKARIRSRVLQRQPSGCGVRVRTGRAHAPPPGRDR